MIQVLGTSSNSGKTLLTMALCRHFSDMGLKVAPFKSLNMSLNSVSLPDGSEISRSVWLQALAARTAPDYHMNPFLLKPEGQSKSQLIVNGRSDGVFTMEEYREFAVERAITVIREDLEFLFGKYDVVVAEGAGSPAEINLTSRDFANIAVSGIWQTPAILLGNIDNGGVFASLYGTVKLMKSSHLVRWLVINQMRGDTDILSSGIDELEKLTDKRVIGVVPHVADVRLPGEDSLSYGTQDRRAGNRIAVIRYPYMENYSEVDPLILAGIGFTYVDAGNKEILSTSEAILLPGSKRVDADLEFLQNTGIAEHIREAADRGARIFGVCGGYQMLGGRINFAGHHDYEKDSVKGLGILDVETIYGKQKITGTVKGTFNEINSGLKSEFEGYEIRYGDVLGDNVNPLLLIEGQDEGAISPNRKIVGSNVHGLLENKSFLSYFSGVDLGKFDYRKRMNSQINNVTSNFVNNLALNEVYEALGIKGRR